MTTRAPAASSSRAVARPIPELAPVTTATVPVRSSMSFSSMRVEDGVRSIVELPADVAGPRLEAAR